VLLGHKIHHQKKTASLLIPCEAFFFVDNTIINSIEFRLIYQVSSASYIYGYKGTRYSRGMALCGFTRWRCYHLSNFRGRWT